MSNDIQIVSTEESDLISRIAELKTRGADHFDTVRFHHVQSMLELSKTKSPSARRIVIARTILSIDEYQKRLSQAEAVASEVHERICTRFKASTDHASVLLANYDFRQLSDLEHALISTENAENMITQLRNLVGQLNELSVDEEGNEPGLEALLHEQGLDKKPNRPTELKSLKKYRLQLENAVTEAISRQVLEEIPENAGPLNPQRLLVRTLEMMKGLSPSYFNRIVSYLDSLLWLDQVDLKSLSSGKPKT